MKAFGLSLIAFAAVSSALAWQTEKRRYIRRMRDLAQFLSLMQGELATYGLPLPELLETLIPRVPESVGCFAQSLLQALPLLASAGFSSLWKRCAATSFPDAGAMEKSVLETVGQTLGRYDLPRQCQVLEESATLLQKEAESQEQALHRNCGLAWGLALTAGAMLAIVLV